MLKHRTCLQYVHSPASLFEGKSVVTARERACTIRNPIACLGIVGIPWRQAGAKGKKQVMTENERRAQDVLTREDLLLRGLATVALVTVFFLVLLTVTP